MDDFGKQVVAELSKREVRQILTHAKPHPSDLMAIFFARDTPMGQKLFPGIEGAKVDFAPKGHPIFRAGWTALDFARRGTLCIGIVGGPFDEHANSFEETKPYCEAVLMAKALGLEGRFKELDKWLKYAQRNDDGDWSTLEVGTSLMAFQDLPLEGTPEQQQAEMEKRALLCLEILSSGVARSLEPITVGKPLYEEFVANGASREIKRRNFRTSISVFAAETVPDDAEPLKRYAGSPLGGGQHVVISKKKDGGTSLFFSPWLVQNVKGVVPAIARALRIEELSLRGKYVSPNSWDELSALGTCDDVPEWYLHDSGALILNGGRSAEDVPPTKIPLEKIRDIVELIIADVLPDYNAPCQRRRFCSEAGCEFYRYGLPWCNGMRALINRQQRR
jgi:hypothetical protein